MLPSATAAVLADCCANLRLTTGDIPPPLVGASTTIVGEAAYVFGGRHVGSRTMTADLYRLSLSSFAWYVSNLLSVKNESMIRDKLWPRDEQISEQSSGPAARYFHSAEAYKVSAFSLQ